jgi:hypothetical protein
VSVREISLSVYLGIIDSAGTYHIGKLCLCDQRLCFSPNKLLLECNDLGR